MSRPVDGPIALSAAPESRWNLAASLLISAGQDGPLPSSLPKRVSASRLLVLQEELTERDREVLLFVQRQRLATGLQLQRMFWPGDDGAQRAARRGLGRLADWRVLDRLPRKIGGVRAGSNAFVYCLGPVGHRLLALDGFVGRRVAGPSERLIGHTLAITEIVVRLHEAERSGALELIEVQTEPQCHRPFLYGLGARYVVKPDLFLRVGAGSVHEDRWFVEVDTGSQNAGVLRPKAERYAKHFASGDEQERHGVYPRIIWAVPDTKRAARVNEILGRAAAQTTKLHVVTTQEALVPLLASEARR